MANSYAVSHIVLVVCICIFEELSLNLAAAGLMMFEISEIKIPFVLNFIIAQKNKQEQET